MTKTRRSANSAERMLSKMKEGKLRLAATITAGLGAGLMAYLTRLHFSDSGESFCDISAELSCDIVNKSLYSEFMGIPMAVLGLVFFLAVIYILWLNPVKKPWRVVLLFSIFSLIFGLYLTLIEHFVIGSICIFCETSKLLMIVLIALSAHGVRSHKEKLTPNIIVLTVLFSIIFSWATYKIQTPPEPKRDFSGVASCLAEKNVYMYGAFGCPHCIDQKKYFGDAVNQILYVECDPRDDAQETERCVEKNIPGTPTWIQETEDGETIKSLPGAHKPEVLAKEFGCEEAL